MALHPSLAPFAGQDIVLVTLATLGRQPLLVEGVAHAWRERVARSARGQAWRLLGHVTLPDHTHLLMTEAPHLTLDQVVFGLIHDFEEDYRHLLGLPANDQLWPRHYDPRRSRSEAELSVKLDYIHYDPVRHGAAARPEEWPHSSYASWIEQGLYKLGWGWTEPETVRGKHWE